MVSSNTMKDNGSVYRAVATLDDHMEIEGKVPDALVVAQNVSAVVVDGRDYLVATDLHLPVPHRVSEDLVQQVPEARNVWDWQDEFFDEENDGKVVAVFDFDYDGLEHYYSRLGWSCYIPSMLCIPSCFPWSLLFGVPCFLNKNVRWNIQSMHVAMTREAIVFVQDRHSTCWGYPCTDITKRTQVIPFAKITECLVDDIAGLPSFCLQQPLGKITIQTSDTTPGKNSLTITGLKNPYGFQALVWAMKRYSALQVPSAPVQAELSRTVEQINQAMTSLSENNHVVSGEVKDLLREIRDELRHHNELMHQMQSASLPTAPVEPLS